MITLGELIQKIDDELIWRRRELTDYRAVLLGSTSIRQTALIRAGVALLYAHWEGFVKKAGTYYLEFVADQALNASELKSNFLSIRFKTQIAELQRSKKYSTAINMVEFFRNKMNQRLRIKTKGVIDTKSNLSSTTFKEILSILGIEADLFETKFNFIDSSIVDRRNHIAHGDSLEISESDYLILHKEVIWLIDQFRTQLQNAAVNKTYLFVP